MLPVAKWRKEHPNLEEGDIVLVKNSKKLGAAEYRYGRVVATRPDDKGLVRSVTVAMRPRDSRDPVLPYKSKKMTEVELPVQRLVLIHPGSRLEDVDTPRVNVMEV